MAKSAMAANIAKRALRRSSPAAPRRAQRTALSAARITANAAASASGARIAKREMAKAATNGEMAEAENAARRNVKNGEIKLALAKSIMKRK